MYRIITRGCGWVAAAAGLIYIMACIFTSLDGPRGVEIPHSLAMVVMSVCVLGAVLSGTGWMIRTDNRATAQRDIRRVVRNELDQSVDRIAKAVAEQLAEDLERRMTEVVERTATTTLTRAIAALRNILLGDEFRDIMEGALARARTYGMVMNAVADRQQTSGHNGVARLYPREDR